VSFQAIIVSVFCSFFRADAQKMEEWARSQNGNSLVEFSSKDGEIEAILKDISERAQGKGSFSYSRFFAVGLFRLLELANATEPTILDKVVIAINNFVSDYHTYFCFTSKLYLLITLMCVSQVIF
jgi:hypothetical protein